MSTHVGERRYVGQSCRGLWLVQDCIRTLFVNAQGRLRGEHAAPSHLLVRVTRGVMLPSLTPGLRDEERVLLATLLTLGVGLPPFLKPFSCDSAGSATSATLGSLVVLLVDRLTADRASLGVGLAALLVLFPVVVVVVVRAFFGVGPGAGWSSSSSTARDAERVILERPLGPLGPLGTGADPSPNAPGIVSVSRMSDPPSEGGAADCLRDARECVDAAGERGAWVDWRSCSSSAGPSSGISSAGCCTPEGRRGALRAAVGVLANALDDREALSPRDGTGGGGMTLGSALSRFPSSFSWAAVS